MKGGAADLASIALLAPEEILRTLPSALGLVDVQNRFLAKKGRDGKFEAVPLVTEIEHLLSAARRLEIPRFFITVASHVNGPWAGASVNAPCLRHVADIISPESPDELRGTGTEDDQAIVAPLQPIPGEVWLHKQRFSAFYETGLEMALRSAGVQAIVVCGVASYGCIYTTCLDATFRGFFAFVSSDATAGADPVLHDAAMTMIGKNNIVDSPLVERAWRAAQFTSQLMEEVPA